MMEWCVCVNKVTKELFVLSRTERETMIGALSGIDYVNSRVVRTFDTQEEAFKYMKSIRDVDDLLKNIG